MSFLFSSVHIPGKILLSGEYSILEDGCGLAISCQASHKVSLFTKDKNESTPDLSISSNIWHKPKLYYKNKPHSYRDDFISQIANLFLNLDLNVSLEIKLQSESTLKGMGSSTAMRIGLFWLYHAYSQTPVKKPEIIKWTTQNQREFQKGKASGFDALCQVHGGLLEFNGLDKDKYLKHQSISQVDFDHFSDYIHLAQPCNEPPSHTGNEILSNLEWANTPLKKNKLKQLSHQQTKFLIECSRGGQLPEEFYSCVGKVRNFWKQSPNSLSSTIQGLDTISECDKNWSFKPVGAGGKDGYLFFGKTKDLQNVFLQLKQRNWQVMDIQTGNYRARSTK